MQCLAFTTPPFHTPFILSTECVSGDAYRAATFARQLLALGADPNLRSRWTNMKAVHYAAYFDVPQLIQVVLQTSLPGGNDKGNLKKRVKGSLRLSAQAKDFISHSENQLQQLLSLFLTFAHFPSFFPPLKTFHYI